MLLMLLCLMMSKFSYHESIQNKISVEGREIIVVATRGVWVH